MKVKASRSEIRECVEKALLRVVNEGKSNFKDDDFGGKKQPKHGKLNKKGAQAKEKGNKGNRHWDTDDEDAY